MVLVFIVFITLAISIFMFAKYIKKSGANKIVVEISKMPKGMLSPAFQDFPYELIFIEEVVISDEKFSA